MRTIPYSDILQRATEATGRIYADLSKEEAGLLKGFTGTRLKQVWEKWPWPELVLVEKRAFRPNWDEAKTYAAREEVYFLEARKYYQSLRAANLANEPATGDPLVENSAWWAECQKAYESAPFDNAKAYAVGDKVFYPKTGLSYQAHTAGTGNLPTDADFWGALTPFVRYVAWEQPGKAALGDVLGVTASNPYTQLIEEPLAWRETDLGILVFTSLPTVWVRFRQRPPFLKGNLFDATKEYAAGEQVYFAQTSAAGNVTGDFYEALEDVDAGDDPDSEPDQWRKVAIPYVFGEYLIHAAAADLLSKDGKDDWSGDEMALANELLLAELDKEERQKGQEQGTRFLVRETGRC